MEGMTTIVPGLLVSLKTQIRGGVTYETTEERVEKDGVAEDRTWRTNCHIADVEELKRAKEARNKAANMVRNACIKTPFGLLCRVDQKDKLYEKLAESRKITTEHNSKSRYTMVNVYVLMGEIANTDREAARAILSDVRAAVEEMKEGLKVVDGKLNVKMIRQAAARAKELGRMLTAKQSEIVSDAVKAARKAANEIAKRVEKGGETAKKVIKELSLKPINDLQFCFLDDESENEPMVKLPKISKNRGIVIDSDGGDE